MTTAAASLPPAPGALTPRLGRTFLHPAIDYLLVGGGLSLVAAVALRAGTSWSSDATNAAYGSFLVQLPFILLLCNSAHFAASTVRLYGKPGATREFPFLTMGLPLATLVLLTFSIAFAPVVGPHLQAVYLTWSPYHYAAQTYGLALMYAFRSGCRLGALDRRLVRLACLAPFFHFFLSVPRFGLEWLTPAALWEVEPFASWRAAVVMGLAVATFVLPAAWHLRLARRGEPVPLISTLVLASNAVWWIVLTPLGAFAVATVAHAVQYLVIVTVFHVKDRVAAPGNLWTPLQHALGYYTACVALGYLLFNVWPYAYVSMGYGLAESMMLVIAVVNIHHFVVDGFIWRLGRSGNRRIVETPALGY